MPARLLTRTLLLIALVLLFITPAGAQPVADSPQKICPLPLGSALPELPVVTLDGKPFDLTAAVKAKPTILIYFRGGW